MKDDRCLQEYYNLTNKVRENEKITVEVKLSEHFRNAISIALWEEEIDIKEYFIVNNEEDLEEAYKLIERWLNEEN